MRPRKVDLAFDWMRSQPRGTFHYRDEVWAALVELHPDEFSVRDVRKTPWFSLHRDMTQDARFLRGDRGVFELVEGDHAGQTEHSKTKPLDHCVGAHEIETQTHEPPALNVPNGLGGELTPCVRARLLDEPGLRPTFNEPAKESSTQPRSPIPGDDVGRVVVASDSSNLEEQPTSTDTTHRILARSNDVSSLIRPQPRLHSSEILVAMDNMRSETGELTLDAPRGLIRARSWRTLVRLFVAQYGDDELDLIARQKMGRTPFLLVAPLSEGIDETNYARVTDRAYVYQKFSADRALEFCKWISRCAGDRREPQISGPELAHQSSSESSWTDWEDRKSMENVAHNLQIRELKIDAAEGALFLPATAPLGAAMRQWRTAKGLTQGEAAKSIGCTGAAWGNWERGLYEPSGAFRSKVIELVAESVRQFERLQPLDTTAGSARKLGRRPNNNILLPLHRNRQLLAHLSTLGELTDGDLEDIGLGGTHISDWLDSLLARRPEAHVVTPLFLQLIDRDASPSAFTTRLAAHFMGEHLRRHAPEPIPELEEHVWERFGRWHLVQSHGGDQKTHAYMSVPIHEPRDMAASERLDLFTQLPPKVIGNLIREPEFLSEQQACSADAAAKSSDGPLSTQLRRNWKRPLLLSTVELLVADDGQVLIGDMERADVIERSYIVAGLPLCRDGEWEPAATLDREAAAERLLQHPVAAAILQFEVQRLFAGLSGDLAARIHVGGGVAQLELDGAGRGPLWRHVRSMLEQVGYWPVGLSSQDSLWASAVHVMLKNLELLDVFERDGDALRLTDDYQSKIKAHPGHLQNRGEKPYRVRLSQFLAALDGGQR
jgi:transcriptional regulator with XRE-family HTH domain